MNPILFSENSTTFTSNGIGRLSDAISCEVTEERNGIYELVMEYPITGIHYESIAQRAIIVAKPSASANNQPFRIYSISRPINGVVTVEAEHISYDLTKNVVMPFSVTASSSACTQALAGLVSNAVETCNFTFTTDVTTVNSYTQKAPGTIRQRLGGIEGSILDQFGGEYEWDNFSVILHADRGSVKNIPLRYGKNLTDIKQDENISKTITGVVPYWVDNEGNNLVTLPEKVIHSNNASLYSQNLTVPLDLSADYDSAPTQTELRNAARAYISQSGVGVPKVSIDISFVNLADTEEYKDIAPLQQVDLCDTIPVQFESLGIDTTAKIVKTVYDVLKEKYKKLTVGSLRSNLATTITDQSASVITEVSAKFAKVGSEINNATAWLTSSNGYVIAVKNTDGTWKELLFLDTNDASTATNVLRINENGIGFSSSGVDGPYTQAWTLDGRLVIGGTNVPSITVYDSSSNIIFKADATSMVWNNANSSMASNGDITITSNSHYYTKLSNGSVHFGYDNNGTDVVVGEISSEIIDNVWSLHITSNGPFYIDSTGAIRILSDSEIALGAEDKLLLGAGSTGRVILDDSTGAISISTLAGHGDIDIESGGDVAISGQGNTTITTESVFKVESSSIQVVDNDNSNSGTGFTGSVAVPLSNFSYVESPSDLSISSGNTTTISNVLHNCTMVDEDGFFKITSYTTTNIILPSSWDITGTTTTVTQGSKNVINGIVVQ